MFTINQLAAALEARRSKSGWIAKCPAHDDRKPSLSIREGRDGNILVHCHTGCEQSAVIAALRARGLWPEREKGKQSRSRNRREEENLRAELLEATSWAITAEMLAEWALEEMSEIDPQRYALTRLLRTIRLGDASIVAEYREWKQRFPEMTTGMVRAGQDHHTRTEVRLIDWVRKRFNV